MKKDGKELAVVKPSKTKKMYSSVLIEVRQQGKDLRKFRRKAPKEVNLNITGSKFFSTRATQRG